MMSTHMVGIHGFEDELVRRPKLLQCEFPVPVSVHQTKDYAHHHRGSDIATATPIVIPGTPNPSFPRPSFQGNGRSSSPSYRRDAGSSRADRYLGLAAARPEQLEGAARMDSAGCPEPGHRELGRSQPKRHVAASTRTCFRISTSLNGDHPAAIQSDVPTN